MPEADLGEPMNLDSLHKSVSGDEAIDETCLSSVVAGERRLAC